MGFWLGILGLIICACKSHYSQTQKQQTRPVTAEVK